MQGLQSFGCSGRAHASGPLPVADSLGLGPTNGWSEMHRYSLTGPVTISENIDFISVSEISSSAACGPAC